LDAEKHPVWRQSGHTFELPTRDGMVAVWYADRHRILRRLSPCFGDWRQTVYKTPIFKLLRTLRVDVPLPQFPFLSYPQVRQVLPYPQVSKTRRESLPLRVESNSPSGKETRVGDFPLRVQTNSPSGKGECDGIPSHLDVIAS
jgi:hypothetical protein